MPTVAYFAGLPLIDGAVLPAPWAVDVPRPNARRAAVTEDILKKARRPRATRMRINTDSFHVSGVPLADPCERAARAKRDLKYSGHAAVQQPQRSEMPPIWRYVTR